MKLKEEEPLEFTSSCPKCMGKMELGFIVDKGCKDNVSLWSQGPPEGSFWSGAKIEHPRKITTHRCSGCGFLESYAR